MFQPDLVFLSESQIFQSDINLSMNYFRGEYSFSLNSEDLHDPELAFLKNKSKGGTLVMWKQSLDPYITLIPVDTPAFLPVLLQIPNIKPSIHIGVYLPTAGKETEFLTELSKLNDLLDEINQKHPGAAIFIRGDRNSSQRNQKRHALLTSFCKDKNLRRTKIGHNTYHHFLGLVQSDSELDILLCSD